MLLPDACPLCERLGAAPCVPCRARLPPPPRVARPPGVDGISVLFAYEGMGRRLIGCLKFRNRRGVVKWMGSELAGHVQMQVPRGDVSCVTWVPSSRDGYRRRGYDTGKLLARCLGRELNLPVRRLLIRADMGEQVGRGRADRLHGPRLRAAPLASRYAGVLVVDDVVTTGASFTAATAALRGKGVVVVHAAAVAATP